MSRRVFRSVEKGVRGVVRGTVRGFDTITGDILDLDQSKQKEMIEAQQKAEQEALRLAKEREAQAKKEAKAQADYDQQVANAKDKIGNDDSLTPDDTGVGLSGVSTDFSTSSKLKNEEKDDDLKKLLRK